MNTYTPLGELLNHNCIELDTNISSKKSLLERAAGLLTQGDIDVDRRDLFEALCQRERLGSTGLGHGVAIPHCRIGSGGVTAAFIRLRKPIEFDSPDSEPVDLFFALAVPVGGNEPHLKLLASVAECFSNQQVRQSLRVAEDSHAIMELFRGAMRPELR